METTEIVKSEQNLTQEINIYQDASTLQITEEEQEKLLAPFDKKEIEIRPDGLIYLPQVFWRERLNQTFGIGQWCLIVKGSFKDDNQEKDKLYLQGILMIRGKYVAEAVGEAELHSNNPNQSWASVWESAKSDCITRCCKDLSIAKEIWQPKFIQTWINKYAIQIWRRKTQRYDKKTGKWIEGCYQWRKKTDKPFWDEQIQDLKEKEDDKMDQKIKTPIINDEDELKEETGIKFNFEKDKFINEIQKIKSIGELNKIVQEIKKSKLTSDDTTDLIQLINQKIKEIRKIK